MLLFNHCYVSSHILISSFMCCFWIETKSPDTLWCTWYACWCSWCRTKSGILLWFLISSRINSVLSHFLPQCSLVCWFLVKIFFLKDFLVKILIHLRCYAGEISRYIYAAFNHEVAATPKFWQRSISAPWMLYIYCTGAVILICANHLCNGVIIFFLTILVINLAL